MCPSLILYSSFITLRTGTIAFVVHDAADIMLSLSSIIESLMPYTIFFMSPLAGAVNITIEPPELIRAENST